MLAARFRILVRAPLLLPVLIIIVGYTAIIVVSYRATPETRTKAECLRSSVSVRNSTADLLALIGALVLLFGEDGTVVTSVAGALITLAFVIAWSADRRERAAEALEQRQGG